MAYGYSPRVLERWDWAAAATAWQERAEWLEREANYWKHQAELRADKKSDA